ncbi:hypothetical protein TNCV_2978801 [Trichonephila clavipes]|nr:hypothetical protein TNCV_2978801 [Trichonephila clavipes]
MVHCVWQRNGDKEPVVDALSYHSVMVGWFFVLGQRGIDWDLECGSEKVSLSEKSVYSRDFGDGPRNFEPRSRDENDTLFPNYPPTTTRGRLSLDRLSVHRPFTRRGFSGTMLELMTLRPQVR